MSKRRHRPAKEQPGFLIGGRALLLALAVVLAGCDGHIGLIGRVLSPAGEPVASATVTLGRPGTSVGFEESTDASGCFQIGGMVSPGEKDYVLTVASPEYEPIEGTFSSSAEYAVLVQLPPGGQAGKGALTRLSDSRTSPDPEAAPELDPCLEAWNAPRQSALTAAPEVRVAERWQCRNDLEVSCGDGGCKAKTADGFTPMSVDFDDAGTISVCAYTGCWEGAGEVFESEDFLMLAGHDLPFSTAPEPAADAADVAIVLNRADSVAMLKVGAFAQPLLCRHPATEPEGGIPAGS